MSIRTVFLSLFFILSSIAQSQFVQIGDGAFLGTIAGPLIQRNTLDDYQSKYAYIFPQSVLGNMQHGDSLTSLSFMRSDGASFNGSCSLKIWLGNVQTADWGSTPLSFNAATQSATEVYYNHPQTHIGPDDRFYKIPFDKPFVFDTMKGNNLSVFVFYEQFDTIPGSIRFYFEGSSTVNAYYSPQVRYSLGVTADDSLRNVTEYHPTIRFSFPKEDQDLDIRKVYTLGKIPVPLGNPDSVKVLLRNVGRQDLLSYKCYTFTKGVNKQKDSFYVNLKEGQEQIVNVPSLSPSNKGTDTVFVESSDNNTSNNLKFSVRWANENIYSYRDITQSPAGGGIGFNGSQGDFVARFNSNKPKNLNQISVAFSGGGRLFKLGIWEHDSARAMPGKLIWDSDSLITKGGTYIYDLPKQVRVNGSFYVGVRQLDLNNVAFGYQMEQPVRPKTFFYAVPLGDTNWVDFHPGAPYKFIIEPRLQADYDLIALDVSLPKDTFNVHAKDTFAPSALIGNMGVNDFDDSFRVRCLIKGPNVLHYDESIFDTLSTGSNRKYNFPKTFAPWEYGKHTLTLIVSHYRDQVIDNDTFVRTFIVGSARDVTIRSAYPSGSSTFIARKDTLQPITTIMNIAFANTGNFDVVSEIWLNNLKISSEKQNLNLGPQGSQILVWSTFPCNDTGRLKWLVYTALKDDEYTPNDTEIFNAFIYKTIDVACEAIITPDSNIIYEPNQNIDIKGRLFNEGVLRADQVKMIFEVYDKLGVLLYQDSLRKDVNGRSGQTFTFNKKFKPTQKGSYLSRFFLADSIDLYPENNVLNAPFYVGRSCDYFLDTIHLPSTISTDPDGQLWSVGVGNSGYDSSSLQAEITATITRNQTIWFEETIQSNVMPDQKRVLSFTKPFKRLFTGTYEVMVIVKHPQDANAINDTLRKTIQVQIAKDVLLDSLSKPEEDQVFYIKDRVESSWVRFRNQGLDSMAGMILKSSWTFEKALLYQSSDTFNMNSNAERVFEFPVNLQFNNAGSGQFRVWLEHPDDEDRSNDTITRYYTVRSKRDLNILQIDSPSIAAVYQTGVKLYPHIKITNSGRDSAVSPGVLVLQVDKNGQSWYTESMPYPRLKPNDTQSVQATQVLYFEEEGVYQLTCFAENNFDENAFNDTFRFPIKVEMNRKSELIRSIEVFPNPSELGYLRILGLPKIEKVTMLDMLGKVHATDLEVKNEGFFVKWSSSLAQGTYILRIENSEGITPIRIIVK